MVVAWWCFACKALHDNVGAQSAQNLHKEVDILLYAPETKSLWMLVPLTCQHRASEELQLVKLHRRQWQRVYLLHLLD